MMIMKHQLNQIIVIQSENKSFIQKLTGFFSKKPERDINDDTIGNTNNDENIIDHNDSNAGQQDENVNEMVENTYLKNVFN